MIIVDQDKKEITNFDNMMAIDVLDCKEDGFLISAAFLIGIDGIYRELGYYKTEERAKEVLHEIVKEYSSYLELRGGPAVLKGTSDVQPNIFSIPKVYEMPKE